MMNHWLSPNAIVPGYVTYILQPVAAFQHAHQYPDFVLQPFDVYLDL
jgi:hypothetical protein